MVPPLLFAYTSLADMLLRDFPLLLLLAALQAFGVANSSTLCL